MRRDELQALLIYDIWATERLLAAADGLSEEAFAAPAGPGHAPIRATLLHMIDGRPTWRLRWQEQPAPPAPSEQDFPTPDAVRGFLEAERVAMHDAFRGVEDGDFDRAVSVPSRAGTRTMLPWHMLVHAVNHGTQHRSEAAAALTLLGRSPGDLDFIDFLRRPGAPPPAS